VKDAVRHVGPSRTTIVIATVQSAAGVTITDGVMSGRIIVGVIDFLEVRFKARVGLWAELTSFYGDRLGLQAAEVADDALRFRIGGRTLAFAPASGSGEPFYHFALLVPGDRFEDASRWMDDRLQLLPNPESGDTLFPFPAWDALASYCLDPAGNIVEFIAHRGVAENDVRGPFRPRELAGFSEVGLVVDEKREVAHALAMEAGLYVWDGELDDPRRLVFAGERARTLILCPVGRGWLPTDRPAEMHPVEVVVQGARGGESRLPGSPHRIIGT
jgi:hypothetical protein